MDDQLNKDDTNLQQPQEEVVTPSEEAQTPDVVETTEEVAPEEETVTQQAEETSESPETTEETQAETKESAEEVAPEEETAEEEAGSSITDNPNAKWYVVHTASGHENKVALNLRQRIESEHLEHKILDILVPTQDKIEIRSGKKSTVKEKIFPGYILVKMDLDDISWLSVRTTPGVTAFVGIGNKPTPIPEHEVRTIVKYMSQGAAPTYKDVFLVNDTVKIVDGPFADFIGKIDTVDKERGKVRVLVSIFGRETPVELDFLQVQKL